MRGKTMRGKIRGWRNALRYRLEHFRAKWTPVRVKKMRQNKNIEPRSDSIGTEKALDARGVGFFVGAGFFLKWDFALSFCGFVRLGLRGAA
jgi:hypothetical protein